MNETGNLAVRERLPEHIVENAPEIDYASRGDYLELLDLEIPVSPSSSSDSSCLTMSSDECFDALALLQDLEPENNNEPELKDAGCKFSVTASIKPTEVVMYPAFSGISCFLFSCQCTVLVVLILTFCSKMYAIL